MFVNGVSRVWLLLVSDTWWLTQVTLRQSTGCSQSCQRNIAILVDAGRSLTAPGAPEVRNDGSKSGEKEL